MDSGQGGGGGGGGNVGGNADGSDDCSGGEKVMDMVHTFTDPRHRGQGLAGILTLSEALQVSDPLLSTEALQALGLAAVSHASVTLAHVHNKKLVTVIRWKLHAHA